MARFSINLTGQQLALLRQMTAASTAGHLANCVKQYNDADTDKGIEHLEYIANQMNLQAGVHRQLQAILKMMVEAGAVSTELQIGKSILDWLLGVAKLPKLDPRAPEMVEKIRDMGFEVDEYAEIVYGLRAALEAAMPVQDETATAAAPATVEEEINAPGPKGIQ